MMRACKTCKGSGGICIGPPEYGIVACPVCNNGPIESCAKFVWEQNGCAGKLRPMRGGVRCDKCGRTLPPAGGDHYRDVKPGVSPVYVI